MVSNAIQTRWRGEKIQASILGIHANIRKRGLDLALESGQGCGRSVYQVHDTQGEGGREVLDNAWPE